MTQNARILIVEDEGLVAMDLQSRLQRLGYTVVDIVDTAARAVAVATAQRPDLTLMDIHLAGGSDGIAAAVEIHAQLGLPIVFLTAYADAATLDRAAAAAPFGYIVKPFEERSLTATLQMALARRAAEQKVKQMERWLATTLHSIGDAVISVDRTGFVNYFNTEAERLTGWLRADALGRDYREVLIFVHEEIGMLPPPHPIEEAFASGLVIHLAPQTELITKTGDKLPVDDSAAPTRDETGAVNGVVMVMRDRSQARRDDEERRKLEQKMQEAQRLESLGVLAGGIAHDFNNLLGAIMMNAEIVSARVPAGSPEQAGLNDILLAGNRAAELCRQMLAYAGKGKYKDAPFDLSLVVEDTATLLNVVVTKKADLRLILDRTLPLTKGDTSQIRQVIMNLMINASDALAEAPGVITIETRRVSADPALLSRAVVGREIPAGDYLQLEVRDSGMGMSEETKARIFDPFFTTKFTGRGLGLAAVLGIVRGHYGALFLESAEGAGSCFRVLLPVVAHEEVSPPSVPEVREHWKSSGTILVVDDEAPIRSAAVQVLAHFGFAVLTAKDGVEALETLAGASTEIRLLLTDLTMPRLNGFETAQEAARLYPELPVVVMSGFSEETASERFASLPIQGYLQKPFSVQALEKTLRRILR